jgi:DNA adenine methylase
MAKIAIRQNFERQKLVKRMIKSPLRYPGGKSRAIRKIAEYFPERFSEFREPFVGGGSVFIYVRQVYPKLRFWINDLNYDLYCFWKYTQIDANSLAARIADIKANTTNGRQLFDKYQELNKSISDFERAVRFFILNRITFSGTVDSGGYSDAAYRSRFTTSSISRLKLLGTLLEDVRITNLDYRDVLRPDGEDVFIFLDPPYLTATQSRLYGKNGHLHTGFDHTGFSKEIIGTPHKWLITYDDAIEIRENFRSANINIYEWQLQYGMNNYKQDKAAKGKELFILNYPVKTMQLRLLEKKGKYRSK